MVRIAPRLTAAMLLLPALLLASVVNAKDGSRWADVEKLTDAYFAALPDWRDNDLITRAEVQPLFDKLQQAGWPVPEASQILDDTLESSDFLVQQLRSKSGQRFMRAISSQALVYDRLDRISRESGGKPLIKHLLRLPDGEVFVKSGRAKTVPGLVELLPKQGGGKSRRVRDFDKPTGKIYTAEQLKQRMQAAYEGKSRPTE